MNESEKSFEEQISMEIERELYGEVLPDAPDEPKTEEDGSRASRKGFILHDFDPPHDRQLAVITHARKLCEYVFVITEKSPKKLRWSIVARLQNTSVDLVENLYRANFEQGATRVEYQKKALVSLKLIDFFTEAAKLKQAINFHQLTVIAKQLAETEKLLSGWIRSEKRKL